MTEPNIDLLIEITRDVIGDEDIELAAEMSAADVPGWDSLNHTLICFQLGLRTGREVDAEHAAGCANFGDLIAYIKSCPAGE